MQLQEIATTVLDRFDIWGRLIMIEPFGDGHINDTFRITTDRTHKIGQYILQRLSPVAFKRPDQVMENVLNVTSFLHQIIAERGGDPDRCSLTLIPLKNGAGWYTMDEEGGCWRVYLMISGSVTYQRPETEAIFREAGRAFGQFQKDLSTYPADTLHETIPHFHDTPSRVAAFRASLEKDAQHRAAQVAEEIAFVLERDVPARALVNQLNAGILPLRVTHNDTKLNNVLLDKATNGALCVIDLDTVMPGLAAYDFGDAIRFGANTAAEDEKDLSKVQFSLPMFRAYAEGYLAECGAMMSDDELASLATGAWMMTFECGMRFLTDYLDGDVYFHTAYPEHNLVRARCQFALLRGMEAAHEQMLAILRECRAAAVTA